MFEKIYKRFDTVFSRLDTLKDYTNRYIKDHEVMHSDIKKIYDKMYKSDHMVEIINSQQRTIEQLTNALKDKYEHGLFIFSEDGKIPMVVRNGKELTNELTTYFNVCWEAGEFPDIEIRQVAGTHYE